MRILVAVDLKEKSDHALRRACQMASESDGVLRVVYAPPSAASDGERAEARHRLHALACEWSGRPIGEEPHVSVRLPHGEPVDAILEEAAHFRPDLIVLGAHGDLRFRDTIFGTTATHVARAASEPVLIVQNDPSQSYAKVMVAVDENGAEEVLRLACPFAQGTELFVVHACGSAPKALFGHGGLMEDVRSDLQTVSDKVLASLPGRPGSSPSHSIQHIVQEGDVIDVLMGAWMDVRPDLVVVGTEGRSGLALLLRESTARSVLLACPSDILVARTKRSARP